MSQIKAHRTTDEPSDDKTIMTVHPASAKSVEYVSKQTEKGMDGRSNWVWIRLANGDLILGCYPQGETYFMVEDDAYYRD